MAGLLAAEDVDICVAGLHQPGPVFTSSASTDADLHLRTLSSDAELHFRNLHYTLPRGAYIVIPQQSSPPASRRVRQVVNNI